MSRCVPPISRPSPDEINRTKHALLGRDDNPFIWHRVGLASRLTCDIISYGEDAGRVSEKEVRIKEVGPRLGRKLL